MHTRSVLFTIIFVSSYCLVSGQQVRSASSEKIYHKIARLSHMTNVLYVAAHPDDENTRLLAWLANNKNIRTAYLSLTRGDGGQNILGSEQGEALGLIRTHELIEARRMDGAEQYFSRAIDFGFSKTYQETFKHWNDYLLTYDATWVMRKFRPDIVICRFPPNTQAGHGQHAASAIIAAKAFKATGSRLQYTEQLKYYTEWQPKRLLWNTFKFGDRNTTSEDQFKLPVGEYLPTLGMGCGELAGQSRSIHKSQGAGTPSVPGIQLEYFKLTDGDTLSMSLFDGIDITWNRVGRPEIGADLKKIEEHFNFLHPDASIDALLSVRKKIESVTDVYWRNLKLQELDEALLDCSGFMAELYTRQPQAVCGATLPFTLHIIARSHTSVMLNSINWGGADSSTHFRISFDTLLTFEHAIGIPASEPFTQPYWLSAPHAGGDMFSIPHDTLLGLPETPNNLNATLNVSIGGVTMNIKVPLSFKKTDPIKGDVVEQLRIVPDASVAFNNSLLITAPDGSVQAEVRIHTFKELKDATLTVSGKTDAAVIRGLNLSNGTDTIIPVLIPASVVNKQSNTDFYLSAELATGGKTYNQSQRLIQYSHLPSLQYFTQPYAKVLRNTWKCTVKRIGFIEGAGDFMPAFLKQAGLDVDVLKESDLTSAAKLKKYDAIVTGIRAVNVEKRMSYWLPVLMQYVENGGTLLMQYNTQQDLATTKLGPYPFTLTSDRVTEEDARVDFIDSTARLLRYPNKITKADFTGWVQERGLYFTSKWDEHYKPLFSMHDDGEQPLTGGTLYCKYGKGNYIYAPLSFSRQLPAGNKGAIRLLMNMLSTGK